MSTLLRGHSAADVLERLAEVEAHCGCAISGPRTARAVRKLGNWLVQERYLDELIFRKQAWHEDRRLPGLVAARTPREIATLLWRRHCGQKFWSHSSADAIRVKSNGRAFYLPGGRPCSIKFLLSGKARQPHNLRNEVEIRRRLAADGAIQVPEIFSSNVQSDPIYICEELVCGRRCQPEDAPTLCQQLLPQLTALYRQEGLVIKPVDEWLDPTVLLPQITRAMGSVEWQGGWVPPAEFLTEAARTIAPGNSLLCSLGHGDLSLSNTLITPAQRIYVIDWELARERPVLFDLRHLLRNVPAAKAILRADLEQLTASAPRRPTLPFERQLFLGALSAIGDLMNAESSTTKQQPARWRSRLVTEFEEANANLGGGTSPTS